MTTLFGLPVVESDNLPKDKIVLCDFSRFIELTVRPKGDRRRLGDFIEDLIAQNKGKLIMIEFIEEGEP